MYVYICLLGKGLIISRKQDIEFMVVQCGVSINLPLIQCLHVEDYELHCGTDQKSVLAVSITSGHWSIS